MPERKPPQTWECPVCQSTWTSPAAMVMCEERCEREERDNRRIYRGMD